MSRNAFLTLALALFFLFPACTRKMSKVVDFNNIPPDVTSTTLLVPKFAYQDPTVYDPYYTNTDSLKQKTGFKYAADSMIGEKSPRKIQHPLIVETNAHLDKYNRDLEKTFKSYHYKYLITDQGKIDSTDEYSDKGVYHYELMRKPVLHCYLDPRGETFLSYRYVYFFHDRNTGRDWPVIQIFSPVPTRTTKAIITSLNSLGNKK